LGSALRKKGIALFGVKVLDVAVLSKGRPVLFYGPASLLCSVLRNPAYLQSHSHIQHIVLLYDSRNDAQLSLPTGGFELGFLASTIRASNV